MAVKDSGALGLLNKIANSAPISVENTVLGEDGLLYCSVCGKPRQCKINVLGVERVVNCICQCEIDRLKEEEEHRKKFEFERKVDRYRKMGFPDTDMVNWTFENDDGLNPKITSAMRSYVEHFEEFKAEGKGLLLYGDVGTGKSYAAACVANELISRGVPCLVTNFARLANTLQGLYEGKQEYIDSLDRFDLLIIDDLAAERNTEYMQEQVFNIINARYVAGLPMIITTNLTGEELKSPDSLSKERIYSRILERCHPISIKGSDRRRNKLKEEHSRMKDILGV